MKENTPKKKTAKSKPSLQEAIEKRLGDSLSLVKERLEPGYETRLATVAARARSCYEGKADVQALAGALWMKNRASIRSTRAELEEFRKLMWGDSSEGSGE